MKRLADDTSWEFEMGIEGVLKEGFVTTSVDKLINWSKTGSLWPMTFGLGLLCRRDDARRCCAL